MIEFREIKECVMNVHIEKKDDLPGGVVSTGQFIGAGKSSSVQPDVGVDGHRFSSQLTHVHLKRQ